MLWALVVRETVAVRRAPQEAGKRSLSDKGQSWASNPRKPEPKARAYTPCHAASRSRRAPGARVSGRGRPPVPMRSSAEGGLSAPGQATHPPDQQKHKGAQLTLTLHLDAQRPSAPGKLRQCGPLSYSHKAGFPRARTGWPGGRRWSPPPRPQGIQGEADIKAQTGGGPQAGGASPPDLVTSPQGVFPGPLSHACLAGSPFVTANIGHMVMVP